MKKKKVRVRNKEIRNLCLNCIPDMDTLTPESLMLAPSLSSSEPESIDDAAPPPLTESFTVSRPPDEVHSTGAEDTISVGELTSVLDSKLGRLRLLAPIKVPGGWVK